MKLSFKFLPLLAFAVFAGFSASALEAKFVSIEGKVEILEGGMWIPVEEGDIIQERGVVISTGFKSNAVVSVKGTNFTLGPLTRITIENMVAMENKDSTQIYIDSGSLKANVSSSDGRKVGFKVRSAVATASVRGTEFKVTSSGRLSVTQGLVSFGGPEASSAEVAKSEDNSTDVAPSEESNAGTVASANETSDGNVAAEEHPESTPFTSSAEVGEKNGVPVFAGQDSKSDVTASRPSNPHAEKVAAVFGKGLENESMGMNLINTTSVEPGAGSRSGSNKGRGSVAITIVWAD
ncbi:MAG: FecR domain-containing protein [Treponema succinifaciens]|uniref:FecR family protein n=1 Tax=Treponema succinifaciens TaxID=167 RepID=UPI002A747AB7|nr:FecR domain-containing protein [Treponema succinifaciens]MDY2616809.1 FecR domain-containing protein [Treponema succinifaciens]